jgi:Arc/MetJ-type ribon-helix-helix transcriptional regulator
MSITLRPEHERLITDALRSGAYQTADQVIERAFEMLRSQEEWLQENRQAIDARIRRGLEQLDRGEGIPEDRLDAYLEKIKAQPE